MTVITCFYIYSIAGSFRATARPLLSSQIGPRSVPGSPYTRSFSLSGYHFVHSLLSLRRDHKATLLNWNLNIVAIAKCFISDAVELTDYFGALPVRAIFHSHRDTRAEVTNTQNCGSTESFAEASCRSYFAIFLSPRISAWQSWTTVANSPQYCCLCNCFCDSIDFAAFVVYYLRSVRGAPFIPPVWSIGTRA